MQEESPSQIPLPTPSLKPAPPNKIDQLAVTPEKPSKLSFGNDVPLQHAQRKKVNFSDDVMARLQGRTENLEGAYHELATPHMNSTYAITKQLEKLKTKQFSEEKALKHSDITDKFTMNQKSAAILNFRRNCTNFKDLVKVDIDKEQELEKSAPKRISYDITKVDKEEDIEIDDIMSFWTPDLVTETAKFDYDEETDMTLLQPNVLNISSDYLTDFYFCKEIASRAR